MKSICKRIAIVALLAAMVLSFAGCGNQSRIGKKTKFVSTETINWILLNKSWSKTSGSGKCYRVLEYKYSGGSWSASGEFSYNSNSLWFTSGAYNGKKFNKSDLGLKYDDNNNVLTVCGHKYKY